MEEKVTIFCIFFLAGIFWGSLKYSRVKMQNQELAVRISLRLQENERMLSELDEKAGNAYRQIRENEEKILALSKEDTLMSYEKQSIVAKFGSFENFEAHNAALYRNYIADLIAKQK